jgi:hypothetical protein
MNTDRLLMKFTKAGDDEEEVAGMSREQLMHAWAEVIVVAGEVGAG